MNHDDLTDEFRENFFDQEDNVRNKIRLGLMNFVLCTLVYALALYGVSAILTSWVEAVDWRLTWIQCTSIVAIINLVRIWDRTFFH